MPTQREPIYHGADGSDAQADAAADAKSAGTQDNHLALAGKKVLWVEDDKFLGSILQKRIHGYGCDVFLATGGDEAFAYLAKEVPHVIVLDLVLPGMSGFDILKKIRDDKSFNAVPILVLSNLNQSGDVERAKILGAEKYMVKAAVSLDEIIRQVGLLTK